MSRWKVGDILICINNKRLPADPDGIEVRPCLTEGKLYKITGYNIFPMITDDFQKSNYFCHHRFKLVTREEKLKRILYEI